MTGNEQGIAAALAYARSLAGSGRHREAIAAFGSLLQGHPEAFAAALDLGALLRQLKGLCRGGLAGLVPERRNNRIEADRHYPYLAIQR